MLGSVARRLASIDDAKGGGVTRHNRRVMLSLVARTLFGCFANRCTTDWSPRETLIHPTSRRRLCDSS